MNNEGGSQGHEGDLRRRLSRRRFLGVAAGVAGAGAVAAYRLGLTEGSATGSPAHLATAGLPPMSASAPESPKLAVPTRTPVPTPTPLPEPPVMPRGREEVRLMQGTEWEASGTIFHSGVAGPRVMVLGGVHGNEPGGWLAAEQVATWEVQSGMLIVLPRLNHRAAAAFQRTFDEIGDLNRMYPGALDGLPMSVMAYEITSLVRQWRPHWFWDMHESWGFFNERGENSGTAFIGQTITTTSAAAGAALEAIAARVNPQIAPREELVLRMRPGGQFGRGPGRSSLSMGTHVPGVEAVLVEMGQMNQSEWRRSELHQLLVRELMTDLQMV